MFVLRTFLLISLSFFCWPSSATKEEEIQVNIDSPLKDEEGQLRKLTGGNKKKKCYPPKVVLSDFAQWKDISGYWIGEHSFYGSDGQIFDSSSWNYRYDLFKGFVTEHTKGNAYRQRNVFLYQPQQDSDKCQEGIKDTLVVGNGKCGINGNSKVFRADQVASGCKGDAAGTFENFLTFDTKTELIGGGSSMLYQVYLPKGTPLSPGVVLSEDKLVQNLLTTFTKSTDKDGKVLVQRARTYQTFESLTDGSPNAASFYRQRKVSKKEFYTELKKTMKEYNIRMDDMCAWRDGPGMAIPSGLESGYASCKAYLEESFDV